MSVIVRKDFIEINGKAVFLYGGDLAYSRVPARSWRERIMQMKAAGLNTVTVYVLWCYHESKSGKFDFTGDRDLGAFLDLVNEYSMYCIFRIGPFVHGEFRNGGLPQWLVDELGPRVRTNDPEYLEYARRWYEKIIEIAKPRIYDNGGPIIMLQLENELGSAGCKGDDLARGSASVEENAKHLLFYYDLIRSSGINLPLLDINHIPDKEKLLDNLVDAGGSYPVNCFAGDGDLQEFSTEWYKNHQRPQITIETGGGMFVRYYDVPAYRNTNTFQGPLVAPYIVEGSIVTHLADGCSGVNLYMFCDGQNPEECGEHMLPDKNMNYQAPLSVVGRMRKSYFGVKRIGWFIRSFGQELLGSSPDESWATVRSYGVPHPGMNDNGDLFAKYGTLRDDDISADRGCVVPSLARVTTGLNLSESNFIFIRNVFNSGAGWKRDLRISVSPSRLACEVWHDYPKKIQLEMEPQTMKIIPFFIRLTAGHFLEYSTAELLDRREFNGKTQVVLCDSPEVMSEIRLVVPDTGNIRSVGNVLVLKESPNTVSLIARAERLPIIVSVGKVEVLLVSREYAANLWDIGDEFAWSSTPLFGDKTAVICNSEKREFCMEWRTVQVPHLVSGLLNSRESFDADRAIYRLTGEFDISVPEILWQRRWEDDAIVLSAELSPEIFADDGDLIVTLEHDGMIGQAYFNGVLVSDHAYGRFLPWEISLRDSVNGKGKLEIFCRGASRCEVDIAHRSNRILRFSFDE